MLFPLISNNPLLTRADLQKAMRDLFDPLLPHFSEGAARVRIGSAGAHYTSSSVELETFSRPLWGLIPLAAGGGSFDQWELYQRGLTNGTDPQHPEFWKHDANQRFVEMAALALGLCQIPEILWSPLSAKARDNLVIWLDTINDNDFPVCNWLFFRIFVNVALRSLGAPHNAGRLTSDLAAIESQYRTGGWYSDGAGPEANRDYYVPFAFHFYGLIYSQIAGNADPERSAIFRERAALFAKDFIYWFAADGSAIPFGRSMTYRFAQVSFWSALAFAKVDVFSPGIIKGLVLRHLRWWFQKPIFSESGLLTIGYGYPNMFMAENYNAPGSPYWALKSFLPLALPESDPFWTSTEEALPELEPISEQEQPGMILCHYQKSSHVVALRGAKNPPGHRHSAEKYCKFAYSTAFAFNIATEQHNLSCRGHDNMLALSEDGVYWRVRGTGSGNVLVQDGIISSTWSPWPDVEISTWLMPFGEWHLRVHHLLTNRAVETAEGGFAIPYDDEAKGNGCRDWLEEIGGAFIPGGESISGIRDLCGTRNGENVLADPNSNLMVSGSAIPTLRSSLAPGEHWLATAVLGQPGNGKTQWESTQFTTISREELAAVFRPPDSHASAAAWVRDLVWRQSELKP